MRPFCAVVRILLSGWNMDLKRVRLLIVPVVFSSAWACSGSEPRQAGDGGVGQDVSPDQTPDALPEAPTSDGPPGPDVSQTGEAANFDRFELHYYSELGTGCPGSCDNVTIIQRNNVAGVLNLTTLCNGVAPESETSVVARLATRSDVLGTLFDPSLCRRRGDRTEEMIVRLVDGRTISNTYSAGCPGAAFEELRTAANQLRTKYCKPLRDAGTGD
jgi:hypothetical protein